MIEVKSYLEFVQIRSFTKMKEYIKHVPTFKDRNFGDVLCAIQDVSEFYSQSFTSELIERYFEGWTLVEGYPIIHDEDGDLIFDDLRGLKTSDFVIRGRYKCKDFRFQAHKPCTLDRFICHCQDAGITLYFKEVKNG